MSDAVLHVARSCPLQAAELRALASQLPPEDAALDGLFEQAVRAPDGVVRAALRLLGGLAAGDAAAFRGARRLKVDRNLWRQRVGPAYRLLFRLEAHRLEILALVSRQEFERAVKRLTA